MQFGDGGFDCHTSTSSFSNLGQVANTLVRLSPSSIICTDQRVVMPCSWEWDHGPGSCHWDYKLTSLMGSLPRLNRDQLQTLQSRVTNQLWTSDKCGTSFVSDRVWHHTRYIIGHFRDTKSFQAIITNRTDNQMCGAPSKVYQ